VEELLNTAGNHRITVSLIFILIWERDCNSPKITVYKENSQTCIYSFCSLNFFGMFLNTVLARLRTMLPQYSCRTFGDKLTYIQLGQSGKYL